MTPSLERSTTSRRPAAPAACSRTARTNSLSPARGRRAAAEFEVFVLRVSEETGELNVKLVYLGATPERCVRQLEQLHAALAPGLAGELRRLPGDGHHLSRENAIINFDFSPVLNSPTAHGLRPRLHLYALETAPNARDLEFLLQGVDVLFFVRAAGDQDERVLHRAAEVIMGGRPPIGFLVFDESRGPLPPWSGGAPGWIEVRLQMETRDGSIELLKRAMGELLARS